MKKIAIEVFTIGELDKKVRENIINKHRYDFSDIATHEVKEYFEMSLSEKGYPTDDIRFSLSNCQGDGVAFYGDIDLQEFIKIREKDLEESLSRHELRRVKYIIGRGFKIDISKSEYFHLYDHYNTMIVEANEYIEYFMYENAKERDISEMIDAVYALEKFLQDDVKSISKDLETCGSNIYDNYFSDDYIVESFNYNDTHFTKDGDIICMEEYEEVI